MNCSCGLFEQAIDDVAALRLPIEGSNGSEFVPAAGVPSFVALFGRDSLIASLQKHVSLSRLRPGNSGHPWLLSGRDEGRHAEPGKIMHELRCGELSHLAGAHSLLVDSDWKGADLATLARRQLAPHVSRNPERVRIANEPVFLPADLATPFGLVFHELATNAAKYDAFSRPAGTVDLSWTLRIQNNEPLLTVVWRENGGPPVTQPTSVGFGSTLIEKAIPNATVRREFRPDGIVCTIEVPLPKTSSVDRQRL